VERDGDIVGAMDLESVGKLQRYSGQPPQSRKDPLVFFENRMRAMSNKR